MKRISIALAFLLLLAAPVAHAEPCWDCQVETGYGGVINDRCDSTQLGAPAKWCTETFRTVSRPDPAYNGPCTEVVCHLHEFCDVAATSPLMFGRPIQAAVVMAEVKLAQRPVRVAEGR